MKGKVVEEGVKHMFSAIVINSDQGSSLRLAILLLCIGHSFLSMVTARAVSIKAWFGRKCSRFVLKSQHGSTHSGILGLSSTKSIHYTVFPGSERGCERSVSCHGMEIVNAADRLLQLMCFNSRRKRKS